MSFNHPKAGPNYVPAYQVSGIPFVTSSVAQEVQGPHSNGVSVPASISFPYVTKFVTVRNTGTKGLRVGFSADGVVAPGERLATVDVDKDAGQFRNYFILPSSGSVDLEASAALGETTQTFDVRCKQIYFLSDVPEHVDPAAVGQATNRGSFTLLAGLTSIQSSQFPTLTGSNGFEGVG
jgi:hypothetical protein